VALTQSVGQLCAIEPKCHLRQAFREAVLALQARDQREQLALAVRVLGRNVRLQLQDDALEVDEHA
jgi:hypothetical protein